jgi:acyl-coenzyme A synthetase/AMP-(fatty) acid ligase
MELPAGMAPVQFNFAKDVVERQAILTPGALASIGVRADGRVEHWTYADVVRASGRLAAAMLAAGLEQGDRVILFLPRTPVFQIAMTACMHIGVVPVPCVTQVTALELSYRAKQCGACGAISGAAFVNLFDEVTDILVFRAVSGASSVAGWADLEALLDANVDAPSFAPMQAETPALMYFTSGSSGLPKAVAHAARGVFVRGWQPWHQLGMRAGDLIWTSSDTGWTRAGSCLVFGPWMHGATALIVENTLSVANRVATLEKFGVSFYAAVATELRQIMSQSSRHPLPALRWTLSAGEAMTAELAEGWRAFSGTPLVVGYGQTETPTATLTDPDGPALNGMIGKPMVNNHLAIIDEAGNEAGVGQEGEIVFDAGDPGLLLGYWVDGKVVSSPRRGRWHLTGDAGYRDASGNLFFMGRSDDVISSAGYRIGPTEVENALMLHPAVAECAVAASPDSQRGEVVKAFVVLAPGHVAGPALAAELQVHVKTVVAPYKYPRAVAFVESLPRTVSGKISRRLLRESEFFPSFPSQPVPTGA